MARWRREALTRLPELRSVINSSSEVMALWIELYIAFERAYEETPRDESLISRVYSYADWCLAAASGPDAGRDPLTAVTVAFYQDIPRFKPARDDMPRWFLYSDVALNPIVYSYHIGEDGFRELLVYMDKHRDRYVPR